MFGQLFSLWRNERTVAILFFLQIPSYIKIGVNLCLFFSKQRFFAKSTWQLSVESAFFKFFNLKSF
ncbi:hypothetical protein DW262_02390 [Segatella copri]|uniref:Uncharacterized protein n=1 Tax=Segatella copri TaxID=165179 RepID=A0A3R6L3N5_9BACT|nr:hypothetical protein DW263_07930 [Segatella copri]RHG39159.1 hypothetical protein DW262_02390 [Segatella copri]RHG66293.1 hypothetical protein DW250_06735 [Segatella copri]